MKEMEIAGMGQYAHGNQPFSTCLIYIAMPDSHGKPNIGSVRLLRDCIIPQKEDIREMKTRVVCHLGMS